MTEAIITLGTAIILAITAFTAIFGWPEAEMVNCAVVAQAETLTMREFYTCL